MILRKRPKRARVKRQKVQRIKPTFMQRARRFVAYPDPDSPYYVEVRVARNRQWMYSEMRRVDGDDGGGDFDGLCRTWRAPRGRRRAVARTQMVARIYLCIETLRNRPSEITAHECGHAAMGWARFRQANLGVMPGEEVMCYALGRLVAQVNHNLYAINAFDLG